MVANIPSWIWVTVTPEGVPIGVYDTEASAQAAKKNSGGSRLRVVSYRSLSVPGSR